MFAIRIKNTYLDQNPKSSVSIQMNNPIFDTDGFPRTWTLPFTLPLTPTNRIALGYPELINFAGQKKYTNAVLYIEGLPFETGTLTITDVSDKYIKVVFQNAELSFLDSLSKIKINEILETVNIPQTNMSQIILGFDAIPNNYSININNINFEVIATNPITYPDVIDAVGAMSLLINAQFPDFASVNTPNKLILAPQNNETLNLIQIQNMTLESNASTAEANQQNLTSFVENIIQNGDSKMSFVTIFNDAFYENSNPAFEGYINYYEDGALKQNVEEVSLQFKHTVIPFVRISYIFQQIVANSDIKAIAGIFYNLADTQQLILYNNYALDLISKTIEPIGGGNIYINGYKPTINLNEHVPEITALEALQLLDFANVYFSIQGETLHIKKKIDQLLQPAIDWTKKAEPDYSIAFNEREGFSLEYPDDESDTATIANQLTEIKIAPAKEQITISVGTIFEDNRFVYLNPSGFGWKIPILIQKGSSDELKTGQNKTEIKLLFDRGLQQNGRGNTYPFGTHKDKNHNGDTIGIYTLDWSGPTGLYETFWKQYLPLLQGDTVTKNIRLGIQDILEIRKWENSRRTIRHQNGHLSGVIKTISFKIDQSGISLAQIEFIKE